MRADRTATAVAVLAVLGLLVSATAAWSRLGTAPTEQVTEPGPAAVAVVPAEPLGLVVPVVPRSAPDQRTASSAQPAPPWRAPATLMPATRTPATLMPATRTPATTVGRSDATNLRAATRQQRTSRPVRARLDGVDIDAAVRPVGVESDGQMQLPEDPSVLGWYRFGAAPGDEGGGATVLAGHLDSREYGLGPLVRLRDTRVKDTLWLTLDDGSRQQYVVQAVTRYDRQRLPDELFSRSGPERVHLITCGGAYDPDEGGYQLNLVVTAVPASVQ